VVVDGSCHLIDDFRVEPLIMSERQYQVNLSIAAAELATALLESRRDRIVLAESCTAGLVSAALAVTPGISQFLCGSFVTYRESAKTEWLGIDPQSLAAHTAVSSQISEQMARSALLRTHEANWSAAITGYLGPDAPPTIDGQVFVAVAYRISDQHLRLETSMARLRELDRVPRQFEAATLVINELLRRLQSHRPAEK
jgi:PncC family amidohydrolase